MRGVPRERRATSVAAASSAMGTARMRADRRTISIMSAAS